MSENSKLKREIDAQGLAAGVVNFIVGAGIFALPALVAVILGFNSILAYIICGVLMFFIMLCFAEIGSQITVSGGPYAYIQAAFGPYIGFLSNVLFWFGYCVLADAAIANAMADMLTVQFPTLQDGVSRGVFFLLIFTGFATVNIYGVKHGVSLVKVLTLIKLIPLVLLVVVGVFFIESDNIRLDLWPSIDSLGEASILLFFAFGGGEGALSTSGEIKDPQKTVPRGVLLGILSVIVLYISIHLVCQGILGESLTDYIEAPLAEAANRIIGNPGLTIFVFAAAVSIFGTLSGSIMQYPRILYAGGRDGTHPSFLSKVHSKYATPIWGIIVYAFLDFVFSIGGGFEQLAIISSAALLLIYLGVVFATLKLRIKNKSKNHKGFQIPGGYSIPVLSAIIIIWFLIQLNIKEFIAVGIFFVILTIIYVINIRLKG